MGQKITVAQSNPDYPLLPTNLRVGTSHQGGMKSLVTVVLRRGRSAACTRAVL